jgi:hypothetical protein
MDYRSGPVFPYRDPQNLLEDEEHIIEITTRWVRVLTRCAKPTYSADGDLLEPRSAEVFPGHSEGESSDESDTSASEDESLNYVTIAAWPRSMVVLRRTAPDGIEADKDRVAADSSEHHQDELFLLGFEVASVGLFFFQCSGDDEVAYLQLAPEACLPGELLQAAPPPPPSAAGTFFL